jgi:RNA polymerase sigma-70 factor (ECF subfamily)
MEWSGAGAEALMKACAESGQPAARDEFVRRYAPVIERTVCRVAGRWGTPAQDTVADLVQDAYAKFFGGALRTYRHMHEDSDFGFVKTVAANVAMDHFRRKAATPVSIDAAPEPAAADPGIDREIAIAQIEGMLHRILPEKSRERDRQVFFLYYRHGMTAKAIAELRTVGLGIKGVESLLHSMTAALRAELRTGVSALKEVL